MNQSNIKNRTLFIHDNLRVLRGMDSNSIDLIATDPPFNAKRSFNAPLGTKAAKQKFDDRWKWDEITDEWHDLIAADHPSIKEIIEASAVIEGGSIDRETGHIDTGRTKNSIAAFLAWMAPRLIEMRRVLKDTGSIYLHCDPATSHYLKLLMDAIFGCANFRNEIVWWYDTGGMSKKQFSKKHDIILFYSKTKKWKFNVDVVKTEKNEIQKKRFEYAKKSGEGNTYRLTSTLKYPHDVFQIHAINPKAKERTGWSTQKPLALYERIIKASSNEGDVVLDPFCGCATTCVAAEHLDRQWIGIDIDPVAQIVTRDRLYTASGINQLIDDSFVNVRKTPPSRTDIDIMSDAKMRVSLWKRQGYKCANPYCSLDEVARSEDLELDHVIPKSRGGSDDLSNRIGLCGNCNKRKSNKAWGRFLNEERSQLAHPVVG